VRFALKLLVNPLRKWDYKAAQNPDYFIANSTHIQRDIKTYYDRDSTVVFPPIDVQRFAPDSTDASAADDAREGFVVVSRQVPQKHIDIVVEACTQLSLPLTVVGNGPENARLRQLAGSTITFVVGADDQEVARLVRSAEAFIFAAFDDFGMVAPEALAAGTPVVAYHAGGALDYVKPGITGEFFEEQTVESLVNTLRTFDPSKYEHAAIRKHAQQFSDEEFRRKMREFLANLT
jgi:glycosyltransferase involved in cell wall biosynthesis